MKTNLSTSIAVMAFLLIAATAFCRMPQAGLTLKTGEETTCLADGGVLKPKLPSETKNADFKTSNQNPVNSNSIAILSNGKPGGASPHQPDNQVLRYDNGINHTAMGSADRIIYAAAYFPASTMSLYTGLALTHVEVYIYYEPIEAEIIIYGPGTSTTPGTPLLTQTISATAHSWVMTELDVPIAITGDDLWICYRVEHEQGYFSTGIDSGPAVAGFGDMVSEDGIAWYSLFNDLGFDNNMNIAGYLTESPAPIVFAGYDLTACEGLPVTLNNASAENYYSLLWTTNGDGAFDNANDLNPNYYFGAGDIANGNISLCLTAYPQPGSGFDPETDCLEITIQPLPVVDIYPDTIKICEGNEVDFTGLIGAQNWSSIFWFVLEGDGTFVDEYMLENIYFPSELDYLLGCIELGVMVEPIAPCTEPAYDFVTVCFQKPPTSFAGNDATICEDETYALTEATAADYVLLFWSSNNGSGTFNNENILNPVYTPGFTDILLGSVDLCLSASPVNPCSVGVTDCMTLTFQQNPVADAGDDGTLCCQSYSPNGSADNHSSVQWSTNGDGSFSDPAIENPTYYPGSQDRINESAELCLTAFPLSPCQVAATDCMTLTITPYPVANAGPDTGICGCEPYTIVHAAADNHIGLQWTITGGTGYLDFYDILHPTYFPSPEDCLQGAIELCLTVFGPDPCMPVTDCMTLSYGQPPMADAGGDETICVGDEMDFAGRVSVSNYSNLQWVSSGMGSFSPSDNVPEPVYLPSPYDYDLGCIQLTLYAAPIYPCEEPAISEVELCFQQLPAVDAGSDATIAGNESYSLSGVATNYTDLMWTTTGDGTFSNPELLSGIYYPGTQDKLNESVELCLTATAISPCLGDVEDCMILSIDTELSVYAGPDDTVCAETMKTGAKDCYQLNPEIIGSYSAVQWSTGGDGFFDDETMVAPCYFHGPGDLSNGFVILTINVIAKGTKLNTSDSMTLTFQLAPTADAGDDDIICCGDSYTFLDATASNYASLLWFTTNGTGSFGNETIINPTYSFSQFDCDNGSVEFCISSSPIDPCTIMAIDCITITIQNPPVVFAGYDQTICEGENAQLSGTAENHIGLLWYTPNGSGTFNNPAVLDAVYTPSAQDFLAGSVELCLIAYGMPPCPVVEDCVTISFCYHPSVYAGQDSTIPCESFLLEEAFAENCSAVQWTTSGDGEFIPDEFEVNPTYYPGPIDCDNGSVTLCITGFPIAPSTVVATHCITLTYQELNIFDCMLIHDESITNAAAQEILNNMGNTIIEGSEYFSRITIETNQFLYETVVALPWVTNIDTNFIVTTWNKGSKELIKANKVMAEPWSSIGNPYQLTGEGVNLGIWDGGIPDPNCLDFEGRLTIMETIEGCHNPVPNVFHHPTHVAGTMAGSGAYPPLYEYSGMAPKANIFAWYYESLNCDRYLRYPYPWDEMKDGVVDHGIVISQNSWGNSFIYRNQQGQVTGYNCNLFGIYTTWCVQIDKVVFDNSLSIFFAAGNDRQEANNYCQKSNYGTIVPLATSKNVVSVGAIYENGSMSPFSLWGPCADGRLKPDVVAKGVNVFSSMPHGSDLKYKSASGTSMATPAVSGAAALMIERYRKIYGGETPRPDLLKNFILNTADDWGPVGPDFQSGYGVVNVEKAIQMIDEGSFMMSNVSHSDEITFPLHVCSDKLQVMLAWSDVEGWTNSNKNLINDLDLELESPYGTIHLPLTLDPDNPQALAVAGVNRRDNVEQVVILSPMHGEWTIRIKGYDVPKNSPQNFSVTWIGGSDKPIDAFIKDVPEDMGFEPNLLSDIMWTSPDILVQQSQCQNPETLNFDADHQNAEYRDPSFPGTENYVYVKIRNKGCNEVSGNVVLHWAKASPGLAWPAPWDGVPIPGYPIMGGIIGTIPFVSLAEGDFTILEFPWNPENPANYSMFGDDQNHFCLLVRIISDDDPMSTPEIYGLYDNVRNNNNIAWKNIIVRDDLPGGKSLIVGNYSQAEMNCKLSLDPVMAEGYNFFDYGFIKLKPTPPLYNKWEEGGFIGEGILAEDSSILIYNTEAWIGNLQFGPGELFGLSCEFITTSSFCNDDTITFRFDLSQIAVAAEGDKILGGVSFRYPYLPVEPPEVYCPGDMLVCLNDDPFLVSGAFPTGGIYSGLGISEGVFYPFEAGVGEHLILYSYFDEYGCHAICGFSITVIPPPAVSAGVDITISEGLPVYLSGMAENYTDVVWNTTNGNGTFDPPDELNTTYFPTNDDYINGSVTICLEATGINPCGDVEDCIEVTFIFCPSANAGDDATICAIENYWLENASATNYSSVFWESTDGDGYFITPYSLKPVYVPGPNDIATGSVDLCLTAYPVNYSFSPATDCMTLHINLDNESCCCPEFVLKDAVEICPPEDICGWEFPARTKNAYLNFPDMAACKDITHVYTVYPNDPSLYTYEWEITGGTPTSYTGNPVSIHWGDDNRGTIKVTITGNDCDDEINAEICLVDGPKADFTFEPNPVCKNSPVNFYNTSMGGDTYHWDFGNGETSNAFNPPDQFYDTPGDYTITLSVTNNFYSDTIYADVPIPCGCTDVISKTITVLEEEGPVIETYCCYGTVCPPGSSTFFTSALCSNYNWGVTGGIITSGHNTDEITVEWDAVYPGVPNTVTLELPECDSAPCQGIATLIVPVIYDNYPISGPDRICRGSSGTFSLPVWPGTYYTWTVTPDYYTLRYQFNKEDRNVANADISFFDAGIYEVKCVYDNPMKGCGGESYFTVEVLPVLSISGDNEACQGCGSSFYANGNVDWSVSPDADVVINDPTSWDTYITFNNPGEYLITAEPVNPLEFCNDFSVKTVKVTAKPELAEIEGPTIVCPNKYKTYSISSNTENGLFEWVLSPYGTGSIISKMGANNDSVVVAWTAPNASILKVRQVLELKNGAPCPSDWKQIEVNPYPVPEISGENLVCANDAVTYAASGIAPPEGFKWSVDPIEKGTILSGNGTNSVSILWHGGGTATGQVMVEHCGGSASMNVVVNDLPPADVTLQFNSPPGTDHPVFCQTDLFELTLSTPNCTDCSYLWYQNGNPFPGSANSISLSESDFTDPGVYKFHVEIENEYGCTARSNIVIIEIIDCEPGCSGGCPGPGGSDCLAYAWFWTYQNCDTVYLINKSEPSDFIATYQWSVTPSGTATISTPNARDAELTVTASGNYNIHLEITDVYGCTTSYSKFVDVLLPTADFTFSSPVCEGEPVFFSAIPNNPTLYDYYWTFGDDYTSNLAEPHHTFDPDNANVTLTIKDRYGCEAWTGFGLEINPVPVCEITASGTHFCPGGFVTLTACSGMASYQWYKDYEPIAGANNAQLVVYQHGEYYVEVANEYGCTTKSESIYIFMHPTPVAKITGDTYVCSGNSFSLKTQYNGTYSYNWSEVSGTSGAVFYPIYGNPASVEAVVPEDITGQYIFSVLVTDNTTGCTALDYVCVTINETPELSFVPQTACEDNPITLTPNPIDPETYHYQWSSGQTDPEITVSTPGEYWLTITNKLTGCNATAWAATIYPKPDLSLFPYGCDTIFGSGQIDFYIPLPLNHNKWWPNTVSEAYHSIEWYDTLSNTLLGNGQNFTYTPVIPGYYEISVVVQNHRNCIDTAGVFCLDGIEIIEPCFLEIDTISVIDESCPGLKDGSISINIEPNSFNQPFTIKQISPTPGFIDTFLGYNYTISNLGKGNYYFEITDASGLCSDACLIHVDRVHEDCCFAAGDSSFIHIVQNTVITENTVWANKYYLAPNVSITVCNGALLDITNVDVVFDVDAGIAFKDGGYLRANNSVFRPCEMDKTWVGLYFEGALYADSVINIVNECTFKNAEAALYFKNGADGLISGNLFSNCHTGIRVENNNNFKHPISGNHFVTDKFYPDYGDVPIIWPPIYWEETKGGQYQFSNRGSAYGIYSIASIFKDKVSQNEFINTKASSPSPDPSSNNSFTSYGIYQAKGGGKFTHNKFTDVHNAIYLDQQTSFSLLHANHIESDFGSFAIYIMTCFGPIIEINNNVIINNFNQTTTNAGIGIWKAGMLSIAGNEIYGFRNGIVASDLSNSQITNNTIDQTSNFGIIIDNNYRSSYSAFNYVTCNEIRMKTFSNSKGIVMMDTPESEISSNCIFDCNTAMQFGYRIKNELPKIRNNFMYNYSNVGINIGAGLIGNIGTSITDPGMNTFYSNRGISDINNDGFGSIIAGYNFGIVWATGGVTLFGRNDFYSNAACSHQIYLIESQPNLNIAFTCDNYSHLAAMLEGSGGNFTLAENWKLIFNESHDQFADACLVMSTYKEADQALLDDIIAETSLTGNQKALLRYNFYYNNGDFVTAQSNLLQFTPDNEEQIDFKNLMLTDLSYIQFGCDFITDATIEQLLAIVEKETHNSNFAIHLLNNIYSYRDPIIKEIVADDIEISPKAMYFDDGFSYLNIYPNPATNSVFVEAVNANSENSLLEIFDISGRKVHEYVINFVSGGIEIDIQNLNQGIYFVTLSDKQSGVLQKGKLVKIL
jgi:hypothetical protein